MDNLIPVNVVIGDRNYRIKIAASDEEVVRSTVKIINDKLLEFKTIFAGKDMQDYIAMVILWYATQQKAAEGQSLAPDMAKKLHNLESLLDKALQEP